MKEHDILKFLLLDIESATPAEYSVRTQGGDQAASPPEIVVSWDATRLPNYNGHTPYVGAIRDGSGSATGKEYHQYFTFDADLLVRHEDELTRDQTLSELHEYFVHYEANPGGFNRDTTDWSIGIAGPRDNSFVEPDWYEAGVPLSFTYVKRTEETDSGRLPDSISDIEVYVNSRDVTIASGDTMTIESDVVRYYRHVTVEGELVVDGELYVTELTNNGTISGSGSVHETDNAYDEIEEITSEIITN